MSPTSRGAMALALVALALSPVSLAQDVPRPIQGCADGYPLNGPECRPDLIIVAPTHVAKDVRHSPNAQVCASFVNIGRTTVATPFHIEAIIDGNPVGDVLVDPPAPTGPTDVPGYQTGQGNGPYCVKVTLPAGMHTYSFRVDSRDTIDETNESNNLMRPRSFEVGDLPTIDLALTAITVTPRYPRVEDQNQIMIARVRNLGEGVSPNATVVFSDENGIIGTAKVARLAPRQATDVYLLTHPPLRPPGDFTLTATVDPDDLIKEVIEENNALSTPYRVPEHPAPDLYIMDVEHGGNFTARRGMYINVTYANQGDRGMLAPKVAILNETNATLAESTARVLNVGQKTTAYFRLTLEAGYHPLRIVVDPQAQMGERNELNNEWPLNLTIFPGLTEAPTPNLVVERLSVAPDDPRPGESVRVSALIRNVGDLRANATEATFYVNGRILGNVTVPAIPAEASVVVSRQWDGGEAGIYEFLAVADPRNRIAEIDEGDNELGLSFIIETNAAPPPPPAPVKPRDEPATPPTTAPPPLEEVAQNATPTPPSLIPGQLAVGLKPVPGGLRGIALLTLRNPSLEAIPRAVVTFKVDGQHLKEILLNDIRPAAIINATTGEIDIPSGRHNLTADIRIIGQTDVQTISRIYEAEAGPKEETPGIAPAALVAMLALAAWASRRRGR